MQETRAALDAAKEKKFRALLRHVNAHSRYYAGIIRERQLDPENCRVGDFPVLTKSVLMANFDDIVTDRRVNKHVIADFLTRSKDPKERLHDDLTVMHTSGTSGEVGYFVYAPADLRRLRAGALRNRELYRGLMPGFGRRLRRLRLAFYGATGGHYAGVTGVASMQRGLQRLFIDARAFEVNSPLGEVVAAINRFRPDALWGYTTALKMLGDEQRAGRLIIQPAVIAATGETVTKADMLFLSGAFPGAAALGMYACTEHLLLGVSNPDGETMTLMDDNLVFELYEDHSLVTNLFNYTLPLIRYRMSDILRPIGASGAGRILVENLVGRSEQMPKFVNAAGHEDFISPHVINEIFVKGVTRFQMQITGSASFRFPICVEAQLDDRQRAAAAAGVRLRLAEILAQKGLSNVIFDVQIVAGIALSERTRKFQLIVTRDPAQV